MNFMKAAFLVAVSTLITIAPRSLMMGQGVDDQMLLHPPTDSWPGYHGDYSGRRHSPLTQITPQNVKNLSLAWAFQTDQTALIKSSPLLVEGILYFTVPENIWAVDARSGHQIWHYTYPRSPGEHIGHRGVAMYKKYLFFLTPDGHLVSLNANDATVRWIVGVADVTKGYWTSMAPLIVGNRVLVGVSGDFDNLTGYIRSIDPETGATQWQWNSTPPAGTPNQTTGGMPWMTGTFDPDLNLVY
jgi:alcohol dehydrogenase (cytochrome c)